jgi:OOP family OmpA-OmpF porin
MKTIIACVTGLLIAAGAQAQSGGYVSLSGGMSKFNEDCTGTSSCDTTGNAAALVGGYEIFKGIAIEGVYLNFGQAKASGLGVNVRIKSNAVGLGGAFRVPLGSSANLVARLGVARVQVDALGSGLGVTVTEKESTTQPYAAIGINWFFTPSAYAEAAYTSTQGSLFGDKATISAFTVGLGLRF